MMSMKANQTALSLLLPKTGQIQSYVPWDDGHYEAGWWKGLLNENNKTRFLAKTLNGDDVVIDLATGLMWAADGNEAGCNSGSEEGWQIAISHAAGLTFAGFNDWRIPNINELASICDYVELYPSIKQPPFSNTKNDYYWASTTFIAVTTFAWVVDFSICNNNFLDKGDVCFWRCVRGGL